MWSISASALAWESVSAFVEEMRGTHIDADVVAFAGEEGGAAFFAELWCLSVFWLRSAAMIQCLPAMKRPPYLVLERLVAE